MAFCFEKTMIIQWIAPPELSFLLVITKFFLHFSLYNFFLIRSCQSNGNQLLSYVPCAKINDRLLPVKFLFAKSPALRVVFYKKKLPVHIRPSSNAHETQLNSRLR